MKIGILATGITPDELLSQYGSYADMFMQLFREENFTFSYQVFDVRDGFFPQSATECDGWIITGSKSNVYENLPWMQQLKTLILAIYEACRPMIGICFGHQIIAEAFGGRVDRYHGGWGVGVHAYELKGDFEFLQSAPKVLCLSAMHQDQVLDPPPNAEVFASSDFCHYAGLIYDDCIMTLQAHPEFNLSYEQDLIMLRQGVGIPDDVADQGLLTVQDPNAQTDASMVATWMAEFLVKKSS